MSAVLLETAPDAAHPQPGAFTHSLSPQRPAALLVHTQSKAREPEGRQLRRLKMQCGAGLPCPQQVAGSLPPICVSSSPTDEVQGLDGVGGHVVP